MRAAFHVGRRKPCASAAAYNYYNPTEHAFLQNGSLIYFSGTLSTSFAPERHPVARYDYNSIMMRASHRYLSLSLAGRCGCSRKGGGDPGGGG